MIDSNVIFENYESYVKDNVEDLNTPSGVTRVLRDDAAFADFRDALIEGQDESSRNVLTNVLNRQRETILEEASNNVGASVFTHGWTVMSFPILVDIYAEPIISQVMN